MRPRTLARLRAGISALALLGAGCLKIPVEGTEAPEETVALSRESLDVVTIWGPQPPGELYEVGEVRAFILRRGDSVLGRSWGRYDGPTADDPPGYRFSTRVELLLPGQEPLRSAGELVLDGRGQLIRGSEQAGPTRLRFLREGELLVITDGQQREELHLKDDDAFMAFAAIFHEELMLGLRTVTAGELSWRLLSLSGSLPVPWSAEVTALAGDPRGGEAQLVTSLGETIRARDRRILAIDVVDEGLEIRPASDPWPTWELAPPRELAYTPAATASFTRREVELPGRPGEPRLAGEVLVPKRAAAGEPLPGVLFLGGTGRQDRYGFTGPPPIDLGAHAITDALAEAGLVVLRFDERGRGASGDGQRSWELQLGDARRALRTLLVQDEVDPDRIILVGHGEGGWRALELERYQVSKEPGSQGAMGAQGAQVAKGARGIRGIALLASPGRPYRALLDEQADADIDALPPELRERAQAEHEATIEALLGGEELPPELVDEAAWARGLLAVDPAALIAAGTAPLWIAQGDRDFEVDPERDPVALQALARGHRRPVKLRRFPGLDHLFKPELGVSTSARYLDPEGPRTVDPGFLEALSAWAKEVTAPAPAKQPRR